MGIDRERTARLLSLGATCLNPVVFALVVSDIVFNLLTNDGSACDELTYLLPVVGVVGIVSVYETYSQFRISLLMTSHDRFIRCVAVLSEVAIISQMSIMIVFAINHRPLRTCPTMFDLLIPCLIMCVSCFCAVRCRLHGVTQPQITNVIMHPSGSKRIYRQLVDLKTLKLGTTGN